MFDRARFQKVAQKTFDDFFAAPLPRGDAWKYCIRTTSGTTGGQLIALMAKSPLNEVKRFEPYKAAILCLGSLSARLAFTLQARHGMQDGARVLAIDGADLSENLGDVLAGYEPDSIFGFVSFVVRLAERIDAGTASRIRLLSLRGECLTDASERFLKGAFPNAQISMRYIATEVGMVSRPSCGHQSRNRYHVLDGVRVEIDDPDETGAGEVLVSKEMHGEYIDRYRTGDIGRWHEEPCDCRAQGTLELLGRKGYDYVKIAGAVVRREECDRVAKQIGLFDDYRMEVSEVYVHGKLRAKLELKAYRKDGPLSTQDVKKIEREFAHEIFLTPGRTLEKLVQDGLFEPLVVTAVTEPFERSHKEIKVVRVDIV